MLNIITELGYNEKEASIYLSLLEIGTADVSSIAKISGVPRTYVYDLAKKLVAAGVLLQTKKEKRIMYSAISPDVLLEKQRSKAEKLQEAMPELKALFNTSGNKPRIYYFEGDAGIQKINEDTLNYKGEIVAFTSPRYLKYKAGRLHKQYVNQRLKKHNKARIIGEYSPEMIELKKLDEKENRQTRMIPPALFNSEIEVGMYGNKVSIVDYKENFGFIIESQEFSKMLKMVFELIWDSGKVMSYKN